MGETTGSEDLGKVLSTEYGEIHKRRKIAEVFPPGKEVDEQQPPDKLVGLALSGGGLRSAIFNLGLLQALSHRGLLKYVDYLSSVSGGGYIAGHLAVKASQYQKSRGHQDPKCYHESPHSELGVCPRTSRHLPDYRFRHAGGYLQDMTGWLGGWLGGTLVTVLLFLTGFGAIATLIALYWRSVDTNWFHDRAEILGIGDVANELEWAFLPALPFVCVWVAVLAARWVDRWFGRGSGQWLFNIWGLIGLWLALVPTLRVAGLDGRSSATVAFWLSLIPTILPITPGFWHRLFLVLGGLMAATLAVTGLGPLLYSDIAEEPWGWIFRGITATGLVLFAFGVPLAVVRGYVGRHITDPDPYRYPSRWMTIAAIAAVAISIAVFLGNSITQVSSSFDRNDEQFSLNSTAVWFAAAAGLFQLIALIGMDRLFRSEAAESSSWQRIAFSMIVTMLIVLPLFALVHWMAREDISSYAKHRDPDLLPTDFRRWEAVPDAISELPSLEKLLANKTVTIDELPSEGRLLDKEKIPLYEKGVPLVDAVRLTNDTLNDATRAFEGSPEWEQRERRLTTILGLFERFQLIYLGDLFQDDRQQGPDRYTVYLNARNDADWVRKKVVDLINARTDKDKTTDQGLGSHALTKELVQLVARKAGTGGDAKTDGDDAPPPGSLAALIGVDAATRDKIDEWFWKRSANPKDELMASEGGTFLTLWDRYARYGLQQPGGSSSSGVAPLNGHLRGLERHEVRRLNRLLLETLYPAKPYVMLIPRKKASTPTVADMDQDYRAWWLLAWLAGFGVMILVTSDFNRISPTFRFYRDALERHFLRPDPKSDDHPLLSELDTCRHGMPYHLFSGCLMIRRCGTAQSDTGGRRDYEHSEVDYYPFLFSRNYCGVRYGSWQARFCPTETYAGGGLQLADAVTVSGSAVSPYMTDNPWLSWFMSAFNIRLGMWLSNPGQPPARRQVDVDDRPQLRVPAHPWNLAKEWHAGFWRTDATKWNLGFVADGGFRENLGVEALLVRQCALIVASDAGNNGDKDQFSSLANLVRLARSEYGIEFYDLDHDRPIDLDRFRRDAELQVPQQILCLRVRYPNKLKIDEKGNITRDEEPWYGLMIYLQMSMTGLEDVDLQQIRKRLPKFPDEPTTNQFYTKEQVEAYRMLGYHIGNIACRDLPDRKVKIGFKELKTRLKMSYLWECRREHARRSDDVSVEALFDLEAVGLTLPDDEVTFQMEGKSPEAWLERYYRDADFRLFQRRRVYGLLNGDRDRRTGPGRVFATDWWEWENDDAEVVGRLLVIAVACHELASGRPVDSEQKSSSGENPRPTREFFRVGGRERFEHLARIYLEERKSPSGKIGKMLSLMAIPKEWFGPRERFLLGVRESVFADHLAATVAALGCCLIRVELEPKPEGVAR